VSAVAGALAVGVVVAAVFGGRPRRRGGVVVVVLALAAASFGGRPRRLGAAPLAADATDAALFGGRPRRRGAGAALAPPDWSFRMAATSAVNSSISSRTSVSRDSRFTRFFFVAFSRRPARYVSSERAAASANSSHST
jgi:hypothetical protein